MRIGHPPRRSPAVRRRAVLLSVTVAAVSLTAGCAGGRTTAGAANSARARSDLITAEQIARSSATNAWQLLRERAVRYRFVDDRYGEPAGIYTRRGRSTIVLATGDSPLLILDGARLSDVRLLRQLPTTSIAVVRFRGGAEGTVAEGTNTTAGVIQIVTKAGGADEPD